MGFLFHISRCNHYDLTEFLPWHISGKSVGYVHKKHSKYLEAFPKFFVSMSDHFALSDNLVNPKERTMAIEEMLEILRTEDPKLSKLNEKYAVKGNINGKTLMEIDRGAADFFGILNTGVHLNGITNDHEDRKMWVATRSHQRKTFPGELDNMVAGGQPSNITRQENVVKECYEEASIPEELAKASEPKGFVSYNMQAGTTLRRKILYVYDLYLPSSFIPLPNDNEVEKFELVPVETVMETIKNRPHAFKYNCNLVIIDFLIREGLINEDLENFNKLVEGLRCPII